MLSSLLFAFQRQHTSICGCRIGTLVEKTSLYANDMLLYLADADPSLSTALETIAHFGHFSGFRVNWSKSVVFPFDLQYTPSMTLQVVAKFRYLGVEMQQPILYRKPWFISLKNFFLEVDALLCSFLWDSLDTLKLPTQGGGLALPDLQSYFLAAQLTHIHARFFPNVPNAAVTTQSKLEWNLRRL